MAFELLRTFASDNGITLSDGQIRQFESFSDMLISRNKVMNLTAITDPAEIEIKHMIDSVYGAKVISELYDEPFSLLDIGCGAGFPGIPLKIVFPQSRFVLMDSLNKRISFVNDVIASLKLGNSEGICLRAEDFSEKESFDICTSRAVAKANVLLEYSLPFVKCGGYCLLYKSGNIEDEIKEADNALGILGGELKDIITFELPDNSGSRSIVVIKKIKATPEKYPRRAGKPSKSPIK